MTAMTSDPSNERSRLQALLASYDLRDGHKPDQAFAMRDFDHIGPGWYGLLKGLIEDLIRLGWDRRVLQTKEKYGSLRFYITQREDAFRERIEAAMDESYKVCEDCGGDGTWLNDNGWMSTLCDTCRARLSAERGRG